MDENRRFRFNPIIVSGLVMIALAVALFCAVEIFKLEHIQQWYKQYEQYLMNLENHIINIKNKSWIFLFILFLYAFKSVLPFPIYPVSFLCVVTGVVFKSYISLAINLLGLIILFSLKYLLGKKHEGAFAGKVLPRNKKVWSLVEHDGNGNPWLLMALRTVPIFPINAVSSLYGSLEFPFLKYLVLSLVGFAPKLVFYTIIGRNVFNPLSSSFILPIAFLALFSGISMICTNFIVKKTNKQTNNEVEK